MKLLLVHNFYRSRHVGGEDVVFRAERSALIAALGEDNVWEYCVSNDQLSGAKTLRQIWGSREHAKGIYDLVNANNIDVVHVHNFFPQLTPSIFKAAKAAGAVTVQTLHNYRWWCIAGTFYHAKKGACQRCVTKKSRLPAVTQRCYQNTYHHSALAALAFNQYDRQKALDDIDAFFYLSKTQHQQLKILELPAHKCHYKPNAVHWPEVCVAWQEKQDYLYIGRLETAKGIYQLLETWKNLPEHFVLRVIGTGEGVEEKYHAPNIKFLGRCSPETTRDWLQRSKYLLQPSLLEETFGLTILEAMASATPVIGFNIGTRQEFIQHEKTGFLCKPEGLRAQVLQSESYSDYANLSKQARIFSKNWSSENILALQLKQYELCIKNQATSLVSP